MAKYLLSIGADAKTTKGEPFGVRTAVMYLAPARASGIDVCKYKTIGCEHGCLAESGRLHMDTARLARLARTEFLFSDRPAFLARLAHEIALFVRACERAGMKPAVRLNGTSDLPWERIRDADGYSMFERFPRVQFYDYTKFPRRPGIPRNYHLTFSLAETAASWDHHETALDSMNVAVVLSGAGTSRHKRPFPRQWNGRRLIDGDAHDLRFTDRPRAGAYIGLRAKGPAIGDTDGFVYPVSTVREAS